MTRKQILTIIMGGAIGNLIEFYNFLLYAFFAHDISSLFFPTQDKVISLILAFSLFALGFISRPVGSLLFGYIGDKYGRRHSLVLSLYMMAVPTFLIAWLPTYQSWGLASPLLLVLFRIMQGIAIGGEYTGSAIFLGEHAPAKTRGLWVSCIPSTTALGVLSGSVVALLAAKILTHEQLLAWGWRVPFMLGALLCLLGVLLRRYLPETPVFTA